ncbi:MAG: hypothetical protein ACI4UE_05965 [Candidatus Scatovivens sp.]
MGFFEKLKRAIRKIKGKLIVAAILVLIITIIGVAAFSVAIANGVKAGAIKNIYFDWQIFFESIGAYLMKPFTSIKLCFTTEYFSTFWQIERFFILVYFLFVVIGILKAFPKHEFDDIEHGSSDWSENGEQYRILSKNKGIVLAEKNYLPVDKRGNVNVLVVRRLWCW